MSGRVRTLWSIMAGQRLLYGGAVLAILLSTVFLYLRPLICKTTIDYLIPLLGPPHIEDSLGGYLYPWNTLPGRWFLIHDWLVGRSVERDLHKDTRAGFIESTRYDAKWGLNLSASQQDRISQVLAQLELAGGAS